MSRYRGSVSTKALIAWPLCLLLGAACGDIEAAEPAELGDEMVTLTQSYSDAIQKNRSVLCGDQGLHAENSYFRVFDLPDYDIASDFEVLSVQVGIDEAYSPSGTQPVWVKLYTLQGDFVLGNLNKLGAFGTEVTNQTRSLLDIPVRTIAPADSTLVVEFQLPNGQQSGNAFRIGANDGGEMSASYMVAPTCNLFEPTAYAKPPINRPESHLVMNVSGRILN